MKLKTGFSSAIEPHSVSRARSLRFGHGKRYDQKRALLGVCANSAARALQQELSFRSVSLERNALCSL